MAELDFALYYDGPALEHHEMDVRDLAPALLSAAELFQSVNEALNPADPPVSVNVRAAAEGSFLVQLKLIYDSSVDVLAGDEVQAGLALSAIVGTIGTLGRLLLKRRASAVVQQEEGEVPGTVRITFADGTTLEVPAAVLRMERNVRIRRSLSEVVAPLGRDGINEVRLERDEEIVLAVEEADYDAITADMPAPIVEPLSDSTREVYLTVLTATFQEGRKWRLSDGLSSFYASLSDQRFLAMVDRGEPFKKQDVLHCEIRTQQWRDSEGLHSDYDIVRVIEHLPAVSLTGTQITLELGPSFADDEDGDAEAS